MTHSITNLEAENRASANAWFVTLDITSLDSAGTETFDPAGELNASGADEYGVSVRGQEDGSVFVTWDHINEELSVVNVSDGTNVADATDVGEVVVEVVGY